MIRFRGHVPKGGHDVPIPRGIRFMDFDWARCRLCCFWRSVVAMFAVMDLIPRSDRALYIMCFALFGLSAASFLSLRREEGWSESMPP